MSDCTTLTVLGMTAELRLEPCASSRSCSFQGSQVPGRISLRLHNSDMHVCSSDEGMKHEACNAVLSLEFPRQTGGSKKSHIAPATQVWKIDCKPLQQNRIFYTKHTLTTCNAMRCHSETCSAKVLHLCHVLVSPSCAG